MKKVILLTIISMLIILFILSTSSVAAQECQMDEHCEQGMICMDYQCVIAEEEPIEQECPEDCDDQDPCTEDWCEQGVCEHAWISECDQEQEELQEEEFIEEECETFVDANDCEVKECNGEVIERICPGDEEKQEEQDEQGDGEERESERERGSEGREGEDETETTKDGNEEQEPSEELPEDIIENLNEPNLDIESTKLNYEKTEYLVEGTESVKLFGIFKVKEKVKLSVDVQTGEIISIKKPWWDFLTSEVKPDQDDDGFTIAKNDCDDNDASINPTATEICDDKDNNCNSLVDEVCDMDNDDYCITGTSSLCPNGAGDCNDKNANIYPAATELCDSLDNDCDTQIDEGCTSSNVSTGNLSAIPISANVSTNITLSGPFDFLTLKDDFNQDGKADILLRQQTSNLGIYAWVMDNANITEVKMVAESIGLQFEVLGTGDFNKDNKVDILFHNINTGNLYLWFMNGLQYSSIEEIKSNGTSIPVYPSSWTFSGIGDFDNNGYSDILWRQTSSGGVYGWLMNGANVVESKVIAETVGTEFTILATEDFDNDKKSDILFHNTNTGYLYLWFMDGLNYTSVEGINYSGTSIQVSSSDWDFSGIGDFDNDGKSDLLWQQSSGSRGVYGWLMDGSKITENKAITESLSSAFDLLGVGDFNGDKKSDILLHSASTGQLYLWVMDGLSYISTPEVKFNGSTVLLS
ncbi:MAG: FG-GAP-like repeat-containing protein [archaeon]